MKITSLTLNNINSFRGKDHHIDFKAMGDQSDLFAITGPTGAGKSTILNAMAMAMFSDNVKGLSAPDLITTGEASGSITLCLELSNDLYRIEWNCLILKKDGTPRAKPTSSTRLYKNNEPIEDKIENILQLNFKQFNQVIVLNQGKFSEFLTSSFSDRKEILEGLLGHKELKDLGQKVRAKRVKLKSEIQSLKDQSEQAQLLTPSDLKIIQQELGDAKEKQKALKVKENITRILTKTLKEIVKLTLDERKNQTRISAYQKKVTDIELNLDNSTKENKILEKVLHEHKEVLKKQKPILELARINANARDNTNNQLLQNNKRTKEVSSIISENLSYIETLQLEELTLRKQTIAIAKQLTKYDNANLQSLSFLRSSLLEIKDIEARLSIHSKTVNQLKIEKSDIEEKGLEYNKEKGKIVASFISTITKVLKEPTFDDILTQLDYWNLLFKDQNSKFNLHKDQILVFTSELQSNQKSIETLEQKLINENDLLSTYKDELLANTQELDSIDRQAQSIKVQLNQYELLLNAKDIISEKLKQHNEDQDCPVCSTTLPTHQWLKTFESLIPVNLQSLQSEYQHLTTVSDQLKKQINKTEVLLNASNIQIVQISKEKKEKQNSISKITEDKNKSESYLSANGGDNNEGLHKKLEILRKIESLSDDIQRERLKWLKNEEGLKTSLKTYNKLSTKKEETLESIMQMGLSRDSINQLEKEIADLDTGIKNHHELEKVNEALTRVSKSIIKSNKDQAEYLSQQTKLQQELKEFNTTLSKLENEKSKNNYPDNPQKETELLENKIEDSLKALEKTRRIKNELQNEFDKNLSQINLLKDQNVEIANLSTMYLENFIKEHHSLKKIKLLPDDKVLTKLLEHTSVPLSLKTFSDNIEIWYEFLNDSIVPYSEQLESNLSSFVELISRYSTQIEQNEKQNQKIANILKERDHLVTSLDELLKLEHYVGKDQFRDFTLAVLEQNLLKVANTEIESLADGRYKLIHAKAGRKSEFLVQDFWQGGLMRKVSTLSGGETFLLSLGLSLGLCEISRGQTEIDCFFIDEGFGTLDSECIEQVLNCLMALQSRGKQIGLISHVKSLTDQIPVRLELSKNNFGESSLSLQ